MNNQIRKDTFISSVLMEMTNILLEDIKTKRECLDLNAPDGCIIFNKLCTDKETISGIIEKYNQNDISDEILAEEIEGLGHLYFYQRFSDIYDYLCEVYQKVKHDTPKSLYDLIKVVYNGASKGEYSLQSVLREIFKGKEAPTCMDFNSIAERLFRFSIEYLHGIMMRCEDSILDMINIELEEKNSNDENGRCDIEHYEDERIKGMIETQKSLSRIIYNSYIFVENIKRGRYGITELKNILRKMDSELSESFHGIFTDGVAMYLGRWDDWKRVIMRSSLQLFSRILNYLHETNNFDDYKITIMPPREYQKRLRKKPIWDLILNYANLYSQAGKGSLLNENEPILLDLIDLNDFTTLYDELEYYKKYGEIM